MKGGTLRKWLKVLLGITGYFSEVHTHAILEKFNTFKKHLPIFEIKHKLFNEISQSVSIFCLPFFPDPTKPEWILYSSFPHQLCHNNCYFLCLAISSLYLLPYLLLFILEAPRALHWFQSQKNQFYLFLAVWPCASWLCFTILRFTSLRNMLCSESYPVLNIKEIVTKSLLLLFLLFHKVIAIVFPRTSSQTLSAEKNSPLDPTLIPNTLNVISNKQHFGG